VDFRNYGWLIDQVNVEPYSTWENILSICFELLAPEIPKFQTAANLKITKINRDHKIKPSQFYYYVNYKKNNFNPRRT